MASSPAIAILSKKAILTTPFTKTSGRRRVYQYAAARMRSEGMQFVHDIGCGSGHKLAGEAYTLV
jgi:hypothetical protein